MGPKLTLENSGDSLPKILKSKSCQESEGTKMKRHYRGTATLLQPNNNNNNLLLHQEENTMKDITTTGKKETRKNRTPKEGKKKVRAGE